MAKKPDRPSWFRILAVFAHPDDEIFCAGGTLARYAAQGAEVMVVSATQGEAGQIHDARAATRRTLGQTRARELQLSCRRLGIQHTLCLNYGDGRLRDNDPLPLTKCLTKIIRTFRPDIVITFGPDGAYGHPDHVTISELTTKAFHLASDSAQFPEQLKDGVTSYRPGRLYYSAFPRNRRLLADQIVAWLVESEHSATTSPCGGGNVGGHRTIEFAHALKIFAEEATMLGYSSDNVAIQWFPQGFYIVEQGEPATKLYLILSGQAEVLAEAEDGTLHLRQKLGPGQFFGELGLAHQQPRAAHVVASQSVTCMVLSPHVISNYEGRGAAALTGREAAGSLPQEAEARITTKIDVSKFIEQKVAALTAHRTQFPLEPAMFPRSMLQELMGYEYFVKVHPPAALENGFVVMSEIMKLRYEQISN
jgi:LmbE family N-acetylglucosaminyl deacetylase